MASNIIVTKIGSVSTNPFKKIFHDFFIFIKYLKMAIIFY
jgi:hypothetical protein